MPRTRSCKDLSASDIQLKIDFPRKKYAKDLPTTTKRFSFRLRDIAKLPELQCAVKLEKIPIEIFEGESSGDDDAFASPKKILTKRKHANRCDNSSRSPEVVNMTKLKHNVLPEENCSPSKSPFIKDISLYKSPLVDRTNFPTKQHSQDSDVDKRKQSLNYSSDDENSPPSQPEIKTLTCKSAYTRIISNNKLQGRETSKASKRKLSLGNIADSSYTKLCQVLHNSIPSKLISRENEINELKKFVNLFLLDSKPGSLYICGAPGTGKTACLTKVLAEYNGCDNLKTFFLNCMSLRQSQTIFSRIASLVDGEARTYSNKESLKYLERKVVASGSKILLVLDEIDQLESKNQDILYKLFELPFLPKSRLALIGIANSLDLTDRILPRLQIRVSCKPALLQFQPYKKDELYAILQSRTREINQNIIDESAVQFCARKVSAMSGDARKALDLLRRAVDVAEEQSRYKLEIPKKVTISHVASVCSEVYGSRLPSTSGADVIFPLQQKIIICTLLAYLKDSKVKEIVLPKLYESYCRVCKSRHIGPAAHEEFIGICNLLESQGILFVKRVKGVTKILLRMQESEVEHALKDKALISSILCNGIPT